jgi:hypothetical protein
VRYDDVFSWHIPEPRHPNTFCCWDERRQAIAQAADKAGHTGDLLAPHGIAGPTITWAGTGSFEFETVSGVYTELRCSYIFMDADYGRNLDRDGAPPRPSSRAFSCGRR